MPQINAQRFGPLSDADAAAWAQLHAAAFADGAADPWSAASFEALSRSPAARLYAAGAVGSPACFAMFQCVLDEAELLTIATNPQEKRAGWARHTLQTALADLKLSGIAHVFLEVPENNHPALTLYKKAGFVKTGRRPQYYKSCNVGIDAIIMRADLTS